MQLGCLVASSWSPVRGLSCAQWQTQGVALSRTRLQSLSQESSTAGGGGVVEGERLLDAWQGQRGASPSPGTFRDLARCQQTIV